MSPPRERRHQKVEEKQNKPAINVDVETTAEADEIPKVEAEVATFKDGTESIHEPKNEPLVLSKLTLHGQETHYFYLYETRMENLAAIKIQTAYRGYLVCFFLCNHLLLSILCNHKEMNLISGKESFESTKGTSEASSYCSG